MASKAKKTALRDALKRVLSSGTDQSKVTWPAMEPGSDQWYDPANTALRKSSAAGYQRDAEAQFPRSPNYGMTFDNPTGSGHDRAFSAGNGRQGRINVPNPDDMGGYFSKPQYLASIISHEVAHNVDSMKNSPIKIPHSVETFRPLESQAYRSVNMLPQYNPGTDVGLNGVNEYPDAYKSLGDYLPHYFVGANPQNLTKSPVRTDPKKLVKALAAQRANFNAGESARNLDMRNSHASLA